MGVRCRLDIFERRLNRVYDVYSRFVSRHPWPFIVFPLLLNVALSVGLLHMKEITDATYLYTPTGARSKYEREVIHQKWPLIDGNYVAGHAITSLRECQSIVSAKDGGNILRAEYAEAVNRFNLFIINDIRVRFRNRTYNYMDLCLHWEQSCFTNPQLGLISTVFQEGEGSRFNLTYPITRLGSQAIYLGSNLGGVRLDRKGRLASADAWLLVYQLQFYPDNNSYVSGLWEKEFQRRVQGYRDPLLRITVFHSQTLDNELERNADHLTPRFALCFLILLVFATLCTLRFINGTAYVDWSGSKPALALMGVISAGIGVSSAVGLMNLSGLLYTQIVAVMPFLIVSVRLDNTFLMISAIRQTSNRLSIEERMGQAMSEAGVSITITVLTDVFSFALGILTNIPAVQIFCAYTTAAIMTTFFNQLTIMMGVLVLTMRHEHAAVHCVLLCAKTRAYLEDEPRKLSLFTRLFMLGSRVDSSSKADGENVERDVVQKFFEDWYAPVLLHPVMKTVVILWFLLYLGLSVWFCSHLREGLEPVNLLVSDSYAIPHYRALEKYFWRYGTEVQIVVSSPPNVADPSGRQEAIDIVRAFANSTHAMGIDAVMFWLFEFDRFVANQNDTAMSTEREFYDSLRHFFDLTAYSRFRYDVLWQEHPLDPNVHRISAYRFYIGIRDFTTSIKQTKVVQSLRAVADQYAKYNVSTFHPFWLFVDQYQEILPNVVQEVVAGISVMVLIALLMIPHPCCSFWVAVTIASIDLGVVGFMTVWGINLDTVSMITIIMSIGFSVDFSAHIAHAFVVSEQNSPTERAKRAISRMAWPVIEGGLSTILGVVVLSNLDSYMVLAFFKTVLLVIVLGMLHAIVFLPVLLSVFVHQPTCLKRQRTCRSSIDTNPEDDVAFDKAAAIHPVYSSSFKGASASPPTHGALPSGSPVIYLPVERDYDTIGRIAVAAPPGAGGLPSALYLPTPLAYCNPVLENSPYSTRPTVADYIPDPPTRVYAANHVQSNRSANHHYRQSDVSPLDLRLRQV